MFTTKFSAPYLPQFTYSEQLQESEKKMTDVEKIKILVEQIYNAYNQIEYKLQSDAVIAQAAINICLYNLCGQDPTQQDDKVINNCDALEEELLNLHTRSSILESNLKNKYPVISASFEAYVHNLQETHTNFIEFCNQDFVIDSFIQDITRNINSSIKDFIAISRTVLELDFRKKIENKKLILEVAEYLCKVIKSKFEISNQISMNAELYKKEIEEVLVFLAKYSCVHCDRWPNTKQLSEQFFKDAERAVYNTSLTLQKHTPHI